MSLKFGHDTCGHHRVVLVGSAIQKGRHLQLSVAWSRGPALKDEPGAHPRAVTKFDVSGDNPLLESLEQSVARQYLLVHGVWFLSAHSGLLKTPTESYAIFSLTET